MLRAQLNDALKAAMKAHDARAVSTLRMVLAKLKDQDIAARAKGNMSGIGDAEIQQMLQAMVKQRRESIALYKQGNRPELVEQEEGEIAVIERFMPKQLSDAEMEAAVADAIAATGAKSAKDMGRVMAVLREKHAGQIDMAKAGAAAKARLG
ncbi:MAG TPA: GatB/YqeY domain-containing protein [Stellaceae bacterium]|nr:GatB/YqeY domain-containing protein [Stellaceae bacterium]HZS81490.1 GatB/YqeY domain-containing protein [Stellaceae bacterium]